GNKARGNESGLVIVTLRLDDVIVFGLDDNSSMTIQ
ncbi:MAG: hypothetical protein ACI89D_002418, partial [Bermanella sp.]